MSQDFQKSKDGADFDCSSDTRDLTLEYIREKTALNERIVEAIRGGDSEGLSTSLGSTAKFRERWDRILIMRKTKALSRLRIIERSDY